MEQSLSTGNAIFLLLAILLALTFEFVNGFHDTANAVATVIYTRTWRPIFAVVWSGLWNLIGVLTSSGAVAFGVIALLPIDVVLNIGSATGFATVFALLISAIIWNLGTWYFGLPASSSHTLVGSILGVGLASSMVAGGHTLGEGVNWAKASEVGLSLLVSPLIGFVCAAALLWLSKAVLRKPELYRAPDKDGKPPMWVRAVLISTCTGVSFAHGSNDGQKGMGLIMLILIGILPFSFAVDMDTPAKSIEELTASTQAFAIEMEMHSRDMTVSDSKAAADELSAYLKTGGATSSRTFAAVTEKCREVAHMLEGKNNLNQLGAEERRQLRANLYLTSEALAKLAKQKHFAGPAEVEKAAELKARMDKITKFIPAWVKMAVALALGLGTMIGWKRIVVTVGEKIGKEHLTYAQGAAAEIVAMCTILGADKLGLPVSTTHVLSSGVAGTMFANRSGLQMRTMRNLLLAWVLTLPVCVLLGAAIFAFGLNLLLRLGVH